MTVEIRKAAHRHWLQQVLERGDDSDLEAWLSPAHVLHQSLVPHLEPGPRALQQLVRRLRVVFHPWLVHVAEQVCEGDCVMTRFTAHRRHRPDAADGRVDPRQRDANDAFFRRARLRELARSQRPRGAVRDGGTTSARGRIEFTMRTYA